MSAFQKAADIYKRYGFTGFCNKLEEKINSPVKQYDRLKDRFLPDEEELETERGEQEKFSYRPLISIVVPAYETKELFLEQLFVSLFDQTYTRWELCIADGSRSDRVEKVALEYQKWLEMKNSEYRIRYKRLEKNDGISENTNEGLKLATGDYIGFMDHDDVLSPNALYHVVKFINRAETPEMRPDLVYTDEDKVSADLKTYTQPHFKPDFNLELLRDNNYICHFTLVSKELLGKVKGFRKEFDGSQDYDFILRCVENTDKICHVPRVLYHWRMHDASTAGNSSSKDYTFDAAKRALEAHFERLGIDASVEKRIEVGCFHIAYPREKGCLAEVLPIEDKTDFSLLDAEIRKADAEYIVLMDPALVPEKADWMEEFLSYCMQENVGMVGAKTFRRSGKVDQNGLVYNCEGKVMKAFHLLKGSYKGYNRKAVLAQEVSGVHLRFAMFKKEAYIKAGGINISLPELYRDMDLAFGMAEAGYRIIQDPYVQADYKKIITSATDDMTGSLYMRQHYAGRLAKGDPYYSPNFSQTGHTYVL